MRGMIVRVKVAVFEIKHESMYRSILDKFAIRIRERRPVKLVEHIHKVSAGCFWVEVLLG